MLGQESFKASTHTVLGWNVYIALAAVVANVIVVLGGSALAYALGWRPTHNLTESDYHPGEAPKTDRDPIHLEPQPS